MNKNIDYGDLREIIGFFEGEGHFGIKDNRATQQDVYNLSCHMANTHKGKLDKYKKLLDIGNVRLVHQETITNKIGYQLDIRKFETQKFAETILPYLNIKKYQALIILRWFKETTDCCIKKGTIYRDRCITPKEAGLREFLFEEMKLLNKRGPYTKEELVTLQEIKYYYDWWFKENYPEQYKTNKEFNK
jgi:hypothetical protein